MTRLSVLIAKLMRGTISRREFSDRACALGFGALTAESILDNVASAQEVKSDTFEPFSDKTPYEQWMSRERIPVHGGYYIPDVRKVELKPWDLLGVRDRKS